MILKAYKCRLEPTEDQILMLDQMVGNARFVWNKMLEMNLYRLENHYSIIRSNEMCKILTLWKQSEEMEFLKLSVANTLQQKVRDQDRAFKDAFDKKQPLKKIPRFKKKGRSIDSIRFPNGPEIHIKGKDNNIIRLNKLGDMKFRRTQRIKGIIRNVTISKNLGYWMISILVKTEIKQKKFPVSNAIGIDMGITKFATITDGKNHRQLEPLNSFRKSEARLNKAQRKLKHKIKFSNNWKKQQKKIAKIRNHIANQRKDYLHKISTDLSKNHAMIFVENLKIKNMSTSAKGDIEKHGKNIRAKSGLNKSILDQGWGMFFQMLEYKLNWNGGQLWKVDPKNTSRCCPVCGHTSAENRKTQSSFICTHCNYSENADIVGALNVLSRGLRAVMPVEVVA